jgi:hypothetical protein
MRYAFATLVLGACIPLKSPEGRTATIDAAVPQSRAAVPGVDAASSKTITDVVADSPQLVTFLGDGTLLAVGDHTLVARATTGAIARALLPPKASVQYSNDLAGVIVLDGDVASILATPSLALLHRGPGAPLTGSSAALAVDDGQSVLVQSGDRFAKLTLPTELKTARPTSLVGVLGGTRFNLTVETEAPGGGTLAHGVLYEATGAHLGKGIPLEPFAINVPRGGHANDAGFFVEGKRVFRVDFRTAAITAQRDVSCPRDRDVGNPTPSPSGELLLVTCGEDAVVLDGRTLTERRRFPRVIPGCDNGPVLGGVILPDNHTMRLQGCGGEARVDLATARYLCGDSAGLLGAPYDVGVPTPGVTPSRPHLPAGRASVRPCNEGVSDGTSNIFGLTGRYRIADHGKGLVIEHAKGTLPLENLTNYPVIAPDDSSVAFLREETIFVQRLPDGAVVAQIPFVGPLTVSR